MTPAVLPNLLCNAVCVFASLAAAEKGNSRLGYPTLHFAGSRDA